ncbi:hypothetical protein KGQ20_46395 [Catenulispora sp. NF23]|uniref:NTF2 fold immunity protein n=1 Tax=Catenulispora pinistramenti TaxID=2705254 RepID=UPI001BA50DE6|nr:NTF2 fold immunity protein [Catenulispora pinistramenti]MBS2540192.1 hypothetical protein [Catenulispora pinistramenti]
MSQDDQLNDQEAAGAGAAAQNFFDEMRRWEEWMESCRRDTTHAEQLAAVKTVFNKYLAKRALARHQSRYEALCFGTPPEFGGPILRVEQETPGKCWVYVPEGLIGGEARYAMVREDGAWKAAFKEVDVALTGKWKRWLDL